MIKYCACYFLDGMINIKNLVPDNIKIEEKYKKYSYLLHWLYNIR